MNEMTFVAILEMSIFVGIIHILYSDLSWLPLQIFEPIHINRNTQNVPVGLKIGIDTSQSLSHCANSVVKLSRYLSFEKIRFRAY